MDGDSVASVVGCVPSAVLTRMVTGVGEACAKVLWVTVCAGCGVDGEKGRDASGVGAVAAARLSIWPRTTFARSTLNKVLIVELRIMPRRRWNMSNPWDLYSIRGFF